MSLSKNIGSCWTPKLRKKRKDDDTSALQREERTLSPKSRPRQSVVEEIDKIPAQRHQLLHEEVRKVVPGMVIVVRGGTNVREIPDSGKNKI